MRDPTEMEMRVAKAMQERLFDRRPGFVDDDNLSGVSIDGSIDLYAFARAAIRAMREPTDAMRDAEFALYIGDGKYSGNTWRAMIDAASPEAE